MARTRTIKIRDALAQPTILLVLVLSGCLGEPAVTDEESTSTKGNEGSPNVDPSNAARAGGPADTSRFIGSYYINYELDAVGTTVLRFRVPEGVQALNVTAYLEAPQEGPYTQLAYSNPGTGYTTNNVHRPPVGNGYLGQVAWHYVVPHMAGVAERADEVILGPYQGYIRDPEPGWWRFGVGGEGHNLRARWDLTLEYGQHGPGTIVGVTHGISNSTVEVIGPIAIPWAPSIAASDRIHQNFTIGANASHFVAVMNAIVPREGPYYLTAKSDPGNRFADVNIAQYHEETVWRKGFVQPAVGNAEAPFTHEGPFNATIENPAQDTWKLVTIGMGENIQLQAMIYVTYPAPDE